MIFLGRPSSSGRLKRQFLQRSTASEICALICMELSSAGPSPAPKNRALFPDPLRSFRVYKEGGKEDTEREREEGIFFLSQGGYGVRKGYSVYELFARKDC